MTILDRAIEQRHSLSETRNAVLNKTNRHREANTVYPPAVLLLYFCYVFGRQRYSIGFLALCAATRHDIIEVICHGISHEEQAIFMQYL